MRIKWILPVISLILFLSLPLVAIVSPGHAQDILTEKSPSVEPELSGHLETTVAAPALIATVNFTKTIEAVTPFSEFRYFWQMEISNMPSGTFSWNMDFYNPEHYSALNFYGIGGDGCTQQSDMDIVCDDISNFYLEFRYTNLYTLQSNQKETGIGATFTGFSLNHYLTLKYVEPWEFIQSVKNGTTDLIEPIFHENQILQWEILNNTKSGIRSTFLDPRIENVFLPLVVK